MNDYLYAIGNFLNHQYQFNISSLDKVYIAKVLEARMAELSISTYAQYFKYLTDHLIESDILHKNIFNSYTEFNRDKVTFSILEEEILPKMIRKKGNKSEFRVWSVGCSTGQEAYSIIMVLKDIIEFYRFDTKVRLFATDRSKESLEFAKKGCYSNNAIQNLKFNYVNRYFELKDDTYAVIPELKKVITFSYYDVLDPNTINPPESIYGNFDLILCSNVLIYYQPLVQQKIIQKLIRNLSEESYLVLGKTERNLITEHSLLKANDTLTGIYSYEKRKNI